MIWKLPGREILFPRRPLVMGIVNLSEDSFSGDGMADPDGALRHAGRQAGSGADIIDVGAESARTNREAIPVGEELERLASFLEAWPRVVAAGRPRDDDQVWPPILSVNTWRPEVVGPLLSGWPAIDLVNDMGGLPEDANARACAAAGVSLLIMHTAGPPKQPRRGQRWGDVVSEMCAFFERGIGVAEAAGLERERILIDPGVDFAKGREDNLAVLRELGRLQRFGRPVLVPLSRKTVIGEVLGIEDPARRDAGTVGLIAAALRRRAQIVRVHNVAAAWQAVKVLWEL